MDGCIFGRMDGCVGGWINGYLDGCTVYLDG